MCGEISTSATSIRLFFRIGWQKRSQVSALEKFQRVIQEGIGNFTYGREKCIQSQALKQKSREKKSIEKQDCCSEN
jgi:hypothetical protein